MRIRVMLTYGACYMHARGRDRYPPEAGAKVRTASSKPASIAGGLITFIAGANAVSTSDAAGCGEGAQVLLLVLRVKGTARHNA